MKKLILVLGIVLLVGACDNGDMENDKNPLIGTWEDSNDDYIERFEFSEKAVSMFYENHNTVILENVNPITHHGNYQYSDSHIVFEWNDFITTSADYIINDNKLILTHNLSGKVITYTKKTN